jgi:hypothetical protein
MQIFVVFFRQIIKFFNYTGGFAEMYGDVGCALLGTEMHVLTAHLPRTNRALITH